VAQRPGAFEWEAAARAIAVAAIVMATTAVGSGASAQTEASPGATSPVSSAAPASGVAAASSASPVAVALEGGLLQPADLPEYLVSSGIEDPTTFDIDQATFEAKGGERAISQAWASPDGPVYAVIDFRMQLPTAEAAIAYLDAAEPILSEADSGGAELEVVTDTEPIGEDGRHYTGTAESLGETIGIDTWLFRVGSVAAKVLVAGRELEQRETTAIAAAAAARMAGTPPPEATGGPPSTVPGTPPASVAPEAEVLLHVPALIVETCRQDDPPFGVGTAVTCDTIDPVVVSYTLLDSVGQANQLWVDASSTMEVPPGGTSCEDGPYSGPYEVEGIGSGRILCTSTGSEQVYLWTRDDLPILSFAVSDTFGFEQMYGWWLGAGPYP
jgi:hypothetical protein